MNQWYGWMNWPVEEGWECEVCGASRAYLVWGLAHGICRCEVCHTQYGMRDHDEDRTVLSVPRLRLRPNWEQAVKVGWPEYQKPHSEWTEKEWLAAFEKAGFKRGAQIIYVPEHCDGDLEHPDAEEGFITSIKPKTSTMFCRYWSKHHDGLRTLANSEGTPIDYIVLQDTRPQHVVDTILKELE